MKNLKNILSVVLVLALTLSLSGCGSRPGVTKQEVMQMIETTNKTAYTTGYSEGLNDGLKSSENLVCNCPNCSKPCTPPTPTPTPNPNTYETPEVTLEKHLPIMFNKSDNWIDQNGEEMSKYETMDFFQRNHEYGRVAVAINRLCDNAKGPQYSKVLDEYWEKADAKPFKTGEYLAYEWILSEMSTDDCDQYLDNLYELIKEDIDCTRSTSAETAARIILCKLLEFQTNGTYDSAINIHLTHDCEVEGCNKTTIDVTPQPAPEKAKSSPINDPKPKPTPKTVMFNFTDNPPLP